jgi:hypothetical protein
VPQLLHALQFPGAASRNLDRDLRGEPLPCARNVVGLFGAVAPASSAEPGAGPAALRSVAASTTCLDAAVARTCVYGIWFWVWGLGCSVYGSGISVECLEFMVDG